MGNVLIPASLSIVGATYGCDNKVPTYGTDLKNWTIVPKKSPNNPKIPNDSKMNPKKECFNKINKIPNMKHKLPRILLGLVKKVIVL
jgi:hypothetical protein